MQLRGPRLSLLLAMALVAVAADICGWIAIERRDQRARQIEMLRAELRRREDRFRWSERMSRAGYVSKAQLVAERAGLKHVESELEALGGPRVRATP